MRSAWLMSLACLAVLSCPAVGEDTAMPSRDELEKAFTERMNGAALVGTFSVEGREGAKPERYEIDSVKKHKGDDWVVTARIKYGEHDLKVPMIVKVFWAGDTPIISLTNLTIPGLGTFTSRVMIYEDRYAGTWQHGDHGGHLWGLIEKTTKKDAPGERAKEK